MLELLGADYKRLNTIRHSIECLFLYIKLGGGGMSGKSKKRA